MDNSLELREMLAIIRKRLWIILMLVLLATGTSALLSYFYITPVYQASTQLLVNKSESRGNFQYDINAINTDLKLIETYNVIIKSPRIMEVVVKDLGLPLTAQELTDKVTVTNVRDSQVISVTVSDESQAQAALIANHISHVFQREIPSIMNVDNVQILTQAKVDPHPTPVKPKPLLNIVIAAVIGCMTGIGIVFLLEYLDTSIRSEEDIERTLEVAVLGSVPLIASSTIKKRKRRNREHQDVPTFEPGFAGVETAAGGEFHDKA